MFTKSWDDALLLLCRRGVGIRCAGSAAQRVACAAPSAARIPPSFTSTCEYDPGGSMGCLARYAQRRRAQLPRSMFCGIGLIVYLFLPCDLLLSCKSVKEADVAGTLVRKLL